MAAKFEKKTEHNVKFAEGGDTPMFGEQAVSAQPSGTTRHGDKGKSDEFGGGGRKDGEFAKGGSGKMFGFAASEPQQPGITSAR